MLFRVQVLFSTATMTFIFPSNSGTHDSWADIDNKFYERVAGYQRKGVNVRQVKLQFQVFFEIKLR